MGLTVPSSSAITNIFLYAASCFCKSYSTPTSLNMYPKTIKKWTIESFNSSNVKNEILDFINYDLEREIDKDFKHNTKLKSQKETILNKIKKWF